MVLQVRHLLHSTIKHAPSKGTNEGAEGAFKRGQGQGITLDSNPLSRNGSLELSSVIRSPDPVCGEVDARLSFISRVGNLMLENKRQKLM